MDNLLDSLQKKLLVPALQVLAILALTWLCLYVERIIRKKLNLRVDNLTRDAAGKARLYTFITVASYMARMFILGVAFIVLLGTLGVDIAPLLASAGIAGLAISLGAQTLIKDFVGGAVILVEDLYRVGDVVQIGGVTGTVEAMTMRYTMLRENTGRLFTIPNGDVRTLSNNSRGWRNAIVDLNLAFDADLRRAVQVLDEALRRAASDEQISEAVIESPQILGWNSLTDWSSQVRLVIKTTTDKSDLAGRVLRQYALEALQQAEIPLALPSREAGAASPR